MPTHPTPLPYHTLRCLYTIEDPDFGLRDVVISPNGQRWISSNGSQIKVWETATGKLLHRLHGVGTCLAVSPNGRLLAAGGYHNREFTIWDLDTGKQRQ